MAKNLLEELKWYVRKNTINQNKAGKQEQNPQNSEQIEKKSQVIGLNINISVISLTING